VGTVAPGIAPLDRLAPGTAARVFTGAMLPDGAYHVVMQEDVACEGNRILVSEIPGNRLVRERGSEAKQGCVLVKPLRTLGPAELATMAHIGLTQPVVIRKPAVRHVVTGDELVDPHDQPKPGCIRDSNTTMIAALLAEFGVEPASSRVPDDPQKLGDAAREPADVLLISGGASVGDFDFGARVLRELGFEIFFDKVNLRPGKPLTFAKKGNRVAFVIPGNPVSHFVCWHVAIRAALEKLMGLPPRWPLMRMELRGGELREHARETFWPAHAHCMEGRLVVEPRPWKGSGDLASLVMVNALVRVAGPLPADGSVEALLLAVPGIC
jgi:molybdopterin molybdotransferase